MGLSAPGPLGTSEILEVTIRLYRSHFATLVKAVAVVVVPLQLVSFAVQATALDGGSLTAPFPEPGANRAPEVDVDSLWVFVAGVVVVSVLSLVAGQLAAGTSLKAVSDAYLGEGPQWRASLRFAASRLRSLLWLALLYSVLLAVAFVAGVVPSIYLYGAWAVAVPVLLLEDARGWAALGRSRELVRGRWWPTFAALLLGLVLVFVVQSGLALVIGGALFVAAGANDVVRLVSQALVGTASAVLATPFSAALVAVVYFDLRLRKEGLDLPLLAPPNVPWSGDPRPTPPPDGDPGDTAAS